MRKSIIFVLIILVLVFCGVSIFFIFSKPKPKQPFKNNTDLQRYQQEETDLKKDLEEKYRADLISYQVMVRRLELEKNKQKELKEKIMEATTKTK